MAPKTTVVEPVFETTPVRVKICMKKWIQDWLCLEKIMCVSRPILYWLPSVLPYKMKPVTTLSLMARLDILVNERGLLPAYKNIARMLFLLSEVRQLPRDCHPLPLGALFCRFSVPRLAQPRIPVVLRPPRVFVSRDGTACWRRAKERAAAGSCCCSHQGAAEAPALCPGEGALPCTRAFSSQ